ncbi:MAG: biotin/lipoyl-binding protein [Pseudomonadota bacterium]
MAAQTPAQTVDNPLAQQTSSADGSRADSPLRPGVAGSHAGVSAWSAWLAQLLGGDVSIGVYTCSGTDVTTLVYRAAEGGPRAISTPLVLLAATRNQVVQKTVPGPSTQSTLLAVPVRDRRGQAATIGCVLPSNQTVVHRTALRLIALAAEWLDLSASAETADFSALVGQLDQAPSCTHAAQLLVDTLAAQVRQSGGSVRVSYFAHRGRRGLNLRAVSGQTRPSDSNAWLNSAVRVGREYLSQRDKTVGMLEATEHGASDGFIRTQHARHRAEYGCQRVMTCGVAARAADRCFVLLVEFFEPAAAKATPYQTWSACLQACGPTLAWHERRERGARARLRDAVSPVAAWASVRRRPLRYAATALVLSGLAVSSVVTVPGAVHAQAEIVGVSPRVISAPRDGYLESVSVRPGDEVVAGQVLAALNTDELHAQRAKWQAEYDRLDSVYHAALAAGDRAGVSVQLARQAEAKAELEVVEEQLERSVLRAQRDSLIAQGDLDERLGTAVKQGEALLETVISDSTQIRLFVSDTDIPRVVGDARGVLILSAQPAVEHQIAATHIKPVATVHDQNTVFIVDAAAQAELPADVLPGMTGYARLDAAPTSLLALWTNDVWRALRVLAWRFGVM